MINSIDKFKKIFVKRELDLLEEELIYQTIQAYKTFIDSKPELDSKKISYTKFFYMLTPNNIKLMKEPMIIDKKDNCHLIPQDIFSPKLKEIKDKFLTQKHQTETQTVPKILSFFIQKDFVFIESRMGVNLYQKLNLFDDQFNKFEYFNSNNMHSFNPNQDLYNFLEDPKNIQALQKIAFHMKNNQTQILSFPKELKKEINRHQLIDFEIEIDKVLSLQEKQNIQNLVNDQYSKYYNAYYKTVIMLHKTDNLCIMSQHEYVIKDNIFINGEIEITPIGFLKYNNGF